MFKIIFSLYKTEREIDLPKIIKDLSFKISPLQVHVSINNTKQVIIYFRVHGKKVKWLRERSREHRIDNVSVCLKSNKQILTST